LIFSANNRGRERDILGEFDRGLAALGRAFALQFLALVG
jgi:hypothetical protein